MTISEAWYQLEFGHCCTRAVWDEGMYIKMYLSIKESEDGNHISPDDRKVFIIAPGSKKLYKPTEEDMFENDWIIFQR